MLLVFKEPLDFYFILLLQINMNSTLDLLPPCHQKLQLPIKPLLTGLFMPIDNRTSALSLSLHMKKNDQWSALENHEYAIIFPFVSEDQKVVPSNTH